MIDQLYLEQFNKIYDKTYNKVLRFIVCKCSNMEDVNDIIQEVYLDFYNALIKEKNIDDFEKYIIGIAKNKVKKYYSFLYRIKTISIFSKNYDEVDIIDTIISNVDIEKIVCNDIDIAYNQYPKTVLSIFAENKLFATLDTTVRKVVIDNLPFLLTDTVGFIRKLPHGLVESFKSTLDEVREADIWVHVVDISHPQFEDQIQVVEKTLSEIEPNGKPSIMVFNKIDAFTYTEKEEDDLSPIQKENLSIEDLKRTWMSKKGENCIFISAKDKTNIEEFKALLYDKAREIHTSRFPYNNFLYENYEEE